MTTRMGRKRNMEKSADSFVKSLGDARDALVDAIEEAEVGDYEKALVSFEEADRVLERARRRAERVADAFDDMPNTGRDKRR